MAIALRAEHEAVETAVFCAETLKFKPRYAVHHADDGGNMTATPADSRVQFPIACAAARGLAQSGFQTRSHPAVSAAVLCAARSRRNLRDHHVNK